MWHMGVSVWGALAVPEAHPDSTAGWHEQPGTTAALAGLRRRLRTALDDGILPTGSDDGERLLLVVEELVSNALRHGRSPVHVHVTAHALGWVTAVSDTAADRPPVPALDRDPAQGGMGLSLVARIGRVHGWEVESDHKIVWARVPYLERPGPERVRAAAARTRTLAARLSVTASRLAGTLDALADQAQTAGRTEFARVCRGRAARARLEAEGARWNSMPRSPPAAELTAG
jgi:anti-sigma regulatory factor (Ser/Thr protein kinase)